MTSGPQTRTRSHSAVIWQLVSRASGDRRLSTVHQARLPARFVCCCSANARCNHQVHRSVCPLQARVPRATSGAVQTSRAQLAKTQLRPAPPSNTGTTRCSEPVTVLLSFQGRWRHRLPLAASRTSSHAGKTSERTSQVRMLSLVQPKSQHLSIALQKSQATAARTTYREGQAESQQ